MHLHSCGSKRRHRAGFVTEAERIRERQRTLRLQKEIQEKQKQRSRMEAAGCGGAPVVPQPPIAPPPPPPAPTTIHLPPAPTHPRSSSSSSNSLTASAVGNGKAWERVNAWLGRPASSKVLLVCGPSGSGKTSGVRALCERMGCRVVELCAPEETSSSGLWSDLRSTSTRKGAYEWMQRPVVLLDDVDGVPEACAEGVFRFCREKPSGSGPVVLTCSSKLPRHLSGLHRHVETVWLSPLTTSDLMKIGWRTVAEMETDTAEEGVEGERAEKGGAEAIGGRRRYIPSSELEAIADSCRGDGRQMRIKTQLRLATGVNWKKEKKRRLGETEDGTDGLQESNDPFSCAKKLLYEWKAGSFLNAGNDSLMLDLLFQNHVRAGVDVSSSTSSVCPVADRSEWISVSDTMRRREVRCLLGEAGDLLELACRGKRRSVVKEQTIEYRSIASNGEEDLRRRLRDLPPVLWERVKEYKACTEPLQYK